MEETFLTMVTWIKTTVNSTVLRKNKLLKNEDIDKYIGIYTCEDPPIEITIFKKDKKLTAKSLVEAVELEYMGGDSFFYSDYGSGFAFLDFNNQTGNLVVSQQGMVYNFRKRDQ